MDVYQDTYLADILNIISRNMMTPALLLLIVLLVVTVFIVGWVVAEFFCERRHFKQNMPAIVNDLNDSSYENVCEVILNSNLLRIQKSALLTVGRNMGLPEEPLFALAQMEIGKVDMHYKKRLGWTDVIAKIAPLMGLMATLIPLGPGIVALGQNDVTKLSQSLGVAFDATVCGLICAILALVVSKIRSNWYSQYIESLESVMTCVIDKANQARSKGVSLPANYTGDPIKESDELLKQKNGGKKFFAGSSKKTEQAPAATPVNSDKDGE